MGLSPQAQLEREVWLAEERTRQEAFQAAESAKIRRTIEDQLRVELNEVLAQHSGINWRSIFCCCWPKRQVGCAGEGARAQAFCCQTKFVCHRHSAPPL